MNKKYLKIKFDYHIFNSQEYGGISKYFFYLYIALSKLDCHPRIIAPIHRNRYLRKIKKEQGLRFFLSMNNRLIIRVIKIISFLYDQFHSRFNKYEIIHKTYFPSKLNFFGRSIYLDSFNSPKSKKIITFYDMSFFLFSNLLNDSKNMISLQKKQCADADAIIAISHSTKNDLIKYYNISKEKISVIHLGVDKEIFFKKRKSNLDVRNFILFVGNRQTYKNFELFVESFAEITDQSINLVLFGGGEITQSEIRLLDKFSIIKKVYYETGDDIKLSKFYNSAKFMVYPSLYEGFGLPVLEAMSCGCPVIAGDNSSISEVADDSALLIDVTKKEAIRDAMNKLINNESMRLSLSQKGIKRSKNFSWEKCANETYKLYQSFN